MHKTLVVNFYGAPGAGKSTVAALVFARLKQKRFKVELVTEYAKDQTWQEGYKVLNNQVYVFAKQHHRVWRVHDKVDIVVTDSPLLMSLAYSDHCTEEFRTFVDVEDSKYDNLNIYLLRTHEYDQTGRAQDEAGSNLLDEKIKSIMNERRGGFDLMIEGTENCAESIVEAVSLRMKKKSEMPF